MERSVNGAQTTLFDGRSGKRILLLALPASGRSTASS